MTTWVDRLGSKTLETQAQLEKLRRKYKGKATPETPPEGETSALRGFDFQDIDNLFPESQPPSGASGRATAGMPPPPPLDFRPSRLPPPPPLMGAATDTAFPVSERVTAPEPQGEFKIPGVEPFQQAGAAVDIFGRGLLKLPKATASAILQATQGKGGASVIDKDWADRFINEANTDMDKFRQEMVDKYGEKLEKSPIKAEDLASLPQNIAFSITSMGAGLGVGLPTGIATANPLVGMLSGSAASGAVAYNMTTYQIMQEYLESKNEEKIQRTGQPLTQAEENKLKEDFDSKARAYGLWEAVPEAISNLAFAKLLTAPLMKIGGKAVVQRIIGKLVGIYGEELVTETVTQKGQAGIEVEAGLREGRLSWAEAFREVAPQTFLLSTILVGTGALGVKSYNRIRKSLREEIGADSQVYRQFNEAPAEMLARLKNITPASVQAVQAGRAELKPEGQPEITPAPEVTKPTVTKATRYSIDKVENALRNIEELAPKETIRESATRRRQLVSAYESLELHARRLGIITPKLGTYYNPEEYLSNARQMSKGVQQRYRPEPVERVAEATRALEGRITPAPPVAVGDVITTKIQPLGIPPTIGQVIGEGIIGKGAAATPAWKIRTAPGPKGITAIPKDAAKILAKMPSIPQAKPVTPTTPAVKPAIVKYPATPAGAEARAQAEGISIAEASRLNAEESLQPTPQPPRAVPSPVVSQARAITPEPAQPPPIKPPAETAVTGVPEPKPTPVQKVREFYKAKIVDIKEVSKIKAISLKDWTDYTQEQRDALYKENLVEIKAATKDKITSLQDWHNYSMESQYNALTNAFNAKIEDMKGINADKIASLEDWARYNISERNRVKGILTDYIQEKLPLRERGKLFDAVKNIKDQKGLDEVIARVDRMAEESSRRLLRTEIIKALKKTVPKKSDTGILKGRFGGEVQEELAGIRQVLAMSKDDAAAKQISNMEAYESGQMPPEDMLEQNNLLKYAGLKEMDSAELESTLLSINVLKGAGRAERMEQLEQFKQEMERARQEIIPVLTGGGTLKKGQVKEFKTAAEWFQKLINGQLALTDFMDKLSVLDKTSKPFQSPLSKFVDNRVTDARNAEESGIDAQFTAINDGFNSTFGVSKAKEANDLLREMGREKVNLGSFKDLDGDEVNLVMTKGQMIDAYNLMQAPENLPTFAEGNRFTPEIIEAIKGGLSAKEKAWADWQRNHLAEYWDSINEVYEPIYGVNLGRNENYWPRNRDIERGVSEHLLIKQDVSHYASVTNGSLKARTNNKIPFKFLDANMKLISHVQQMEHFKAWASSIRDMRSLFMNKDVRQSILQYHGRSIMGKVDAFLNDLARGGIDKAKMIVALDKLRGNVTAAMLGLKPMVAIKQPASMLAYATEMPTGDFITGVADFMKHPVRNYRTLRDKSPGLRARYRAGNWERDIKAAVEGGAPKSITGEMTFRDYILSLLKIGDKYSQTVPGMWAKYKSGLKAGLSDADAIRAAEQATNRTQVASYLETLSEIQRGGSWARLATMFQDQPNKYFRLINANMRNIAGGRIAKTKGIINILIVWVLAPALFQFMSDGFKWKTKRQLRAWLLGPVNNMLVFGQLAQSVYGWVQGDNYEYNPSPVLEIANDLKRAIGRMNKLIRLGRDPTKDISIDDVIATLEDLAKAGGMATGLPTPYGVQVEKAIRSGDPRQFLLSEFALREDEKTEPATPRRPSVPRKPRTTPVEAPRRPRKVRP